MLKIKKSLGNFLAFGARNNTLIWLYLWVTTKILATALMPAILLALVSGELFKKFLLPRILLLDPAQDYFSLANRWFALFLVLICLVAMLSTFFSIKSLLKQTPGNLVYDRDSRV